MTNTVPAWTKHLNESCIYKELYFAHCWSYPKSLGLSSVSSGRSWIKFFLLSQKDVLTEHCIPEIPTSGIEDIFDKFWKSTIVSSIIFGSFYVQSFEGIDKLPNQTLYLWICHAADFALLLLWMVYCRWTHAWNERAHFKCFLEKDDRNYTKFLLKWPKNWTIFLYLYVFLTKITHIHKLNLC